jgi:hypothetical protein
MEMLLLLLTDMLGAELLRLKSPLIPGPAKI